MYRVVIITDCVDVAYSEMRGAILSQVNVPVEIEPLISVKPYSIINAAFLTRLVADSYPLGTVLFTVVSPGGPAQSRPTSVVGRTKSGHVFIGPDLGGFSWIAKDLQIASLHRVKRPALSFATFGAKYFVAPSVAALLNSNLEPDSICDMVLSDVSHVDIPDGTVVHIDNFGNIKLKGPCPDYAEGQKLIITVAHTNKKYEARFGRRFMDFHDLSLIVSAGSSLYGLPEVALTRGNAALNLGVDVGDKILLEMVPA
ncbi:hypothetical protein ANRL3_01905 [Anaerolineae bacterium]|nr:hypothetical protein ANRL3_01905 [Anaerolineae bacterium]